MDKFADKAQLIGTFEARRKACVHRLRIRLVIIGVVVIGFENWFYTSGVEGGGVYASPPSFVKFNQMLHFSKELDELKT
ncbi:MAG: hypothetical protein D6B25_08295 [Desulfobulbaceae bacterium]|nr:MAG: hypothetical protein D6B25_08295 [Desulfobulbaceae bacterium]